MRSNYTLDLYMTHHSENRFLSTSEAIVVAGALIAISIFLGASKIARTGMVANSAVNTQKAVAAQAAVPSADPLAAGAAIVPFSATKDHYLGNPKAKVALIEYSDLECPFCKKFDPALRQLIEKYGDKVVWVYRHMPLSMHPKAAKEAEATECAAAQGGNDAFWKYMARLFEVTPSNNGLDPAQLPEIARYIGLDVAKFTSCLDSGTFAAKVKAQGAEGVAAGGRGTPYGIIVGPKGNTPIGGAVPFETLEAMVQAAMK